MGKRREGKRGKNWSSSLCVCAEQTTTAGMEGWKEQEGDKERLRREEKEEGWRMREREMLEGAKRTRPNRSRRKKKGRAGGIRGGAMEEKEEEGVGGGRVERGE